jgi:phage gp36-like protein
VPATSLAKIRATVGREMALKLLDHDNDGEEDPELVEQVLSFADSDLRTVIGRAYTREEFEKQGEDLENVGAQVAVQFAYLLRPELLDDDGNTPWQKRYDAAVAKLRAIASGAERIDRDTSGRAYRGNAPGYIPTAPTYFLDGTGDF